MFKAISLGCLLLLSPIHASHSKQVSQQSKHLQWVQKNLKPFYRGNHVTNDLRKQLSGVSIKDRLFNKPILHTSKISKQNKSIQYQIIPSSYKVLPDFFDQYRPVENMQIELNMIKKHKIIKSKLEKPEKSHRKPIERSQGLLKQRNIENLMTETGDSYQMTLLE